MVCSNQPTEDGRSPQAGRATLASHQARAGLGHGEGIPNAAGAARAETESLANAYRERFITVRFAKGNWLPWEVWNAAQTRKIAAFATERQFQLSLRSILEAEAQMQG